MKWIYQWNNDTTRRLLRTFLQVFVGELLRYLTAWLSDSETLGAVVGLAAIAALTATMNLERVPNGNPGNNDISDEALEELEAEMAEEESGVVGTNGEVSK